MFRIIEPKDYSYYRARIDLFIGLIKLNQNLPLSCEEQACSTFIIGEGEDGIVHGGAILHKQPINTLPTQLRTFLSTCVLNMEDVWVCTLGLCLENTKCTFLNKDELNFSHVFYSRLLKKLNEFGKKKNISFLCLKLNSFEHLRIKDKAAWSCILEIGPKKSLESLFYGILPLDQQKYKITAWEHREQKNSFKLYSPATCLS